jgi:hypothetical protein
MPGLVNAVNIYDIQGIIERIKDIERHIYLKNISSICNENAK